MYIPGLGGLLFKNWKKSKSPFHKYFQLIWITFIALITIYGGLQILTENFWLGALIIGIGLLILYPYWNWFLQNK